MVLFQSDLYMSYQRKNYEKVTTNWEIGKESKVLIDTKPPNLSLETQWLQK